MEEDEAKISSFIESLINISVSQREGIYKMMRAIVSESKAEQSRFTDGVAFGAFITWGIIKTEQEIQETVEAISKILKPIGLDDKIKEIKTESILSPSATSENIIPDLEKASRIISKRIEILKDLEEAISKMSAEKKY